MTSSAFGRSVDGGLFEADDSGFFRFWSDRRDQSSTAGIGGCSKGDVDQFVQLQTVDFLFEKETGFLLETTTTLQPHSCSVFSSSSALR